MTYYFKKLFMFCVLNIHRNLNYSFHNKDKLSRQNVIKGNKCFTFRFDAFCSAYCYQSINANPTF